ncbi:hypothetical protein ACFE04_024601 [Oxalis oulophora]
MGREARTWDQRVIWEIGKTEAHRTLDWELTHYSPGRSPGLPTLGCAPDFLHLYGSRRHSYGMKWWPRHYGWKVIFSSIVWIYRAVVGPMTERMWSLWVRDCKSCGLEVVELG